ncbi:hypothetical protein D3C81_1283160 [compost metagenome]
MMLLHVFPKIENGPFSRLYQQDGRSQMKLFLANGLKRQSMKSNSGLPSEPSGIRISETIPIKLFTALLLPIHLKKPYNRAHVRLLWQMNV